MYVTLGQIVLPFEFLAATRDLHATRGAHAWGFKDRAWPMPEATHHQALLEFRASAIELELSFFNLT